MHDTGSRVLMTFALATAVVAFVGGGMIALFATNDTWATFGAACVVVGTPFSLAYAGMVWVIDRCMR